MKTIVCLLLVFGHLYKECSSKAVELPGSACANKVADIVVAMDTSGSIWEEDFHSQLKFVQRLVDKFQIGENAVRFGVLTFGTSVYPHIKLDGSFTKDEIKDRIASIPYRGGGTNTGAAIKYARDVMFTSQNGGRKNVDKINIVITDGFSLNFDNTTLEASISRSVGIKQISVGVGLGAELNELSHIASTDDSGEKLVFTVDNFSALDTIDQLLTSTTCDVIQNDQSSVPVIPAEAEVKQFCGGKPADIFFVVDSSSSIWIANYKKMLKFITEVIDMFDMSPGVTRVALVGYSDGIHPFIPLHNKFELSELKKRILNIPHLYGGTKTGSALQYLRQGGFAHARKSVAHVAVVLTDGQSSDTDLTSKESRLLHELGVHVFAIGIGKGVDQEEMKTIGSFPPSNSVFQMDDYNALSAIKNVLAIKACSPDETNANTQDDQKISECRLTSPADVMFVYDKQSLHSKTMDNILAIITELMTSLSNTKRDIRTGILSQVCDSGKRLPLSSYTSVKDIITLTSSAQDHNLPLLVKDLRIHGFETSNGARSDSKKIAVLFIEGRLNNYKQLQLETKRLKYGGAVEVFVVHSGKALPHEIRTLGSQPLHSHVISEHSFHGTREIHDKLLSQICGNFSSDSNMAVQHTSSDYGYMAPNRT